MFLKLLDVPLNKIIFNNDNLLGKLSRLGIKSVSDILCFYPRDWENRSNIVPLKNYKGNSVCTVVKVIAREFMGYGPQKAMKVYIEDDTAQAALLCFNLSKRPWLEKTLLIDSKHQVFGKFEVKKGELQSGSFKTSLVSSKNYGKILPVYPLTSGLKQNHIRNISSAVIKKYINEINDELPVNLKEKYHLLSKKDAIKEIHFPSSMEEIEKAKNTLIYEELFYLEVTVIKRAIERKKKQSNISSLNNKKNQITDLQKQLLERLPFPLTEGQKEAVMQINGDMAMQAPMARLLQGDVGSGKTLVSFLAALYAIENGGQAAVMAPTELLARQHAENAARLLEPIGINIAFLTGNVKSKGRKELLKNLAEGMINIVVGTHALFSKDVKYKNLKLVVIDEQHRFGVTQRALIMAKGNDTGLLMMSATPIPRTLSLTVFGDMDVSVIKDMPPGRKPVITHLAKESNEKKVYDFVRRELEKGRQAYFVYPLIESLNDNEENDDSAGIKDAVSMAKKLSCEVFKGFNTALIHSKISEDEKKKIMDDFRKGEIKILTATSVVEVGVDVPNATCMVIENAQRFGLSALHQLRGRVGRGQEQSYCFLIYSNDLTEDGKTRLKVMLNSNDGFVIAEEDLRLRGPGLITGTVQSGYLVLGIANPIRDMETLVRAREDALTILENDPDLLLENNRVIADVLEAAPPFSGIVF